MITKTLHLSNINGKLCSWINIHPENDIKGSMGLWYSYYKKIGEIIVAILHIYEAIVNLLSIFKNQDTKSE